MRDTWSASKRFRQQIPLLGTGVGVILLLLGLFLMQPPLLSQINLKLYDHYLTRFARPDISPVPLIIDIDEPTLEKYGQWPWPRYRLALVLERLLGAGAAAVALDIVLAEEDRTSPDRLGRALHDELGVQVVFEGLPESLRDNDRLLAETLTGAPVVLGGFIRFGPETAATPDPPSSEGVPLVERSKAGMPSALERIMQGGGLTWPVGILAAAAPVGFFNVAMDQDGLIRRVPLLLRAKNTVYASLALRALMTALGAKSIRLTSGPDGLERIGVGRLSFPVAPDATMLVPYRGASGTFPYLSAGRILDNTFNPDEIRGRVLFIGTSAAGLQDFRSTPLDRYTPGVEVHANVVDAILTDRSMLVPPWNSGLQALVIIATGILCILVFGWLRPILVGLGGGVLLAAFYTGSGYLFFHGQYVTPLWGMLAVVGEGAGVIALRMWRAERDKRQIRNVFSRYVSPEVVSHIVDRGDVVLRGEGRELSIMFTDLRGFTSLSETLSPEQVVSLLNSYFTPMTALVRGSGGTLDKFIGDALMAFWNAPLDVPGHPQKAAQTALSMQDALANLNVDLEKLYGVRLRMGAGIHTGSAHVGNMGSNDLTSYTAIGDAVNLASRLEGLCSRYGVPLVMSGETASRCGEGIVLQWLARLRVKGRHEPVDIFTGMRPEQAAARAVELEQYMQAVTLRETALQKRERDALRHAQALFQRLAERDGHLLYRAYVEDCARMLAEHPSEWSGVWTLTSK